MLAWMRKHPGPLYTSRSDPDYPGSEDYPLEEVINATGSTYFNSTVAYAVAFGLLPRIGVTHYSLFGVDFTYPNAHEAEKGRACVEFWLGMATARGVEVRIAEDSTLMDACVPEGQKLYGYDTMKVDVTVVDGRAKVQFTSKENWPSGAEMEARYDHSQPPSPVK
jgi:hypothetical protein